MNRIMWPASNLSKSTLVSLVAAELDVPEPDALRAVDTTLNIIARTVAGGGKVAITNFGTFLAHQMQERQGRNPQTGETVTVPAKQVARFRVSPRLSEQVAAANPAEVTIRKNSPTPRG